MPPRRSRRSAHVGDAEPPRTPGRELYLIQEVREIILDYMDQDSLAVFMRVEKKCQFDIAKRLYKFVAYEVVRKMSTATARQRMCLAAVKRIDAREVTLTQTVQRALGLEEYFSGDGKKARMEEYLAIYQPDLLRVIIPPLRHKCGNLEMITCGVNYKPFSRTLWLVHLDPDAPRPADGPADQVVDAGGDVQLLRAYCHRLHDSPPNTGDRFIGPTPSYTGSIQFDLLMESANPELGPPRHDEWLRSFRDNPLWGFLAYAIDFADLPVTLGLIAGLYQRQFDVGHPERLRHIVALAVEWSMADFKLLANVASHHLIELKLATGYWDDFDLSFKDLPVLVEVIRDNLPRIRTLWISMHGIETAEADCLPFLAPDSLREGGTITQLHIYTAHHTTSLYNVIRALSPLVTSEAELNILHPVVPERGTPKTQHIWSPSDQDDYLSYLREQSDEVKAHLAIIDFATLGIESEASPSQVYDLHYHPDGSPYSLEHSIAQGWSQGAQRILRRAEDKTIPALEAAMAEYADAAERCRSNSLVATKEEKLAEMKAMLASLEKIGKVARKLPKVGHGDMGELEIARRLNEVKAKLRM